MQDLTLRQPGRRSPPPSHLRPRRPGELQQEEEAYFEMNSDEDEDGTAAGSGAASPVLRATSPLNSPPPAATGHGSSAGGSSTEPAVATHGAAWLPAAGRRGSGGQPGPNLATAFNSARQTGSRVAWPPSAPMSAFAGSLPCYVCFPSRCLRWRFGVP
jgi:hypothetical protein